MWFAVNTKGKCSLWHNDTSFATGIQSLTLRITITHMGGRGATPINVWGPTSSLTLGNSTCQTQGTNNIFLMIEHLSPSIR